MRLHATGIAALLALLPSLLAAGPAAGLDPLRTVPPVSEIRLAQAGDRGGADRAAAVVRSMTGGRVLSVHREQWGGRPVYRVKVLLTAGQVRVFRVDPETGRVVD